MHEHCLSAANLKSKTDGRYIKLMKMKSPGLKTTAQCTQTVEAAIYDNTKYTFLKQYKTLYVETVKNDIQLSFLSILK